MVRHLGTAWIPLSGLFAKNRALGKARLDRKAVCLLWNGQADGALGRLPKNHGAEILHWSCGCFDAMAPGFLAQQRHVIRSGVPGAGVDHPTGDAGR